MPSSVQHLSIKTGQSEHFRLVLIVHSGAMQVTLFDVQQRTAIADLTVPFIKYIVWSSDMNHVALLSKHAIIVANKRLGQAFTGASHWNSSCAGVYLCCDWAKHAFAQGRLHRITGILNSMISNRTHAVRNMASAEPQEGLHGLANGWPAKQARSQQCSNLLLPQYGCVPSKSR